MGGNVLRVGIVGNNLYGQVFTRAVEAAGRAQAVAMCPELDEPLEPFASEHQLKAYPDLGAMLNVASLDVVMLGCVTTRHSAAAQAALKAGAHVLIDRPLAPTLEACDQIIAVAKATQRVAMVGHVLQFWPEYVTVREMIQRGDLGKPFAVTASRVSGLLNPSWRARLLNPAYGLGCLEAHTHDIDFLCGLWGQPNDVWAQGRQTADGAWIQVQSLLNMAEGCRAGVEADYAVPFNFPLSMYLRVVGDAGTLVFTFRGALAARAAARRNLMLFRGGADPVKIEVPPSDAYVAMVNHFIDCIQEGKPPEWGTLEQARQSLRTLLAISQSAAQIARA